MLKINIFQLLLIGFLLRLGFFIYGIYQDSNFTIKYTDVDYFVFHDAARFVYKGQSPYLRDTYRYTPLLSWLLIPNHYLNWIHAGKILFILFDLLTGYMIFNLLIQTTKQKKILLSSLWILNPIVVVISTRGNAEAVLCFLIIWFLYHLQKKQYILSGLIYGLSIHFKIYPIIYCLPISLFIYKIERNWISKLLTIGLATIISLSITTYSMFSIYKNEYLEQAYVYHLIRTDHRHNFSIWNILLYLNSANNTEVFMDLSKAAFMPQMLVCCGVIYILWEKTTWENLLNTFFLQTYAFVTYNKVVTSQYFIWFLVFLPFYLMNTTLTWKKGILFITIWLAIQSIWLLQGYYLEFEGKNVFYPELFFGNVQFFIGNVYLLSIFINDIKKRISSCENKMD